MHLIAMAIMRGDTGMSKITLVSSRKWDLSPRSFDLQLYFAEHESLREKVKEFGSFWVTGGNAFGLRLCMNLSGFDTILLEMYEKKADVLYGGYSAGICILGNDLRGIEIMDEVDVHPYGEIDFIWEGIGILDYTIIPHVDSDHLESELATKVVEYMIKNNLPFKPLRDRETIIISE